MPFLLTMSGLTDPGRVRARNEDDLALDPDLGLAVVADGLGGHRAGDVASRTAVREARAAFGRRIGAAAPADADGGGHPRERTRVGPGSVGIGRSRRPSPESVADLLGEAMAGSVVDAHRAVLDRARADVRLHGMGTTVVCVCVDEGTGAVVVAHVGDSRAYRLRGEALERLTRDDSWVWEEVDAGRLRPAEAAVHPRRSLLSQCLGQPDFTPRVHVRRGRARPGDVYLLCTDGLTAVLGDVEIFDGLTGVRSDPAESLGRLVAAANEAGGPDNVTVAAVVVEEG